VGQRYSPSIYSLAMSRQRVLSGSAAHLLSILLGVLIAVPAHGQATDAPIPGEGAGGEKRAQASMKFTSISVSPRVSALANAATSLQMGSVGMFYNPASMARVDRSVSASLGSVQWIANIQHDYASVAYGPNNGKYGVFGIMVRSVDYGEVNGTIRADNEQGYIETGTLNPSALEAGISYAMAITSNFSVGGSAKWARQDLGTSVVSRGSDSGSRETRSLSKGTPVFDFGVRYLVGFHSLSIAMNARNFSSEISFGEQSFELPLSLRMGLSMNLMDLTENYQNHDFRVAVDAEVPRDFVETVKVGGEYEFMDIIALRAGYLLPERERGVSLGGGLSEEFGDLMVQVNYSFVRFNRLSNVNRFGVNVGF